MALRLALDCRALEAADYFDIFPGGTKIPAAVLMTGCVANGGCVGPVSASNPLPVAGTFTASLGGFTPSASGARMTPLSVGTSDSSGPLPTGTVVVVSNAGTTNPMFCNVNGLTATVSNQPIPPFVRVHDPVRDRCYHATAVLLPEGRVFSAGGGEYAPENNVANPTKDTHAGPKSALA
jgi:hypothetical protein